MKPVRCAIYTRKSSEDGLEQDFNSLHAQREACAAYILSQASEGWTQLAEDYDDGGLSGGTLERPALQRLLADVADGKVDIIVVYKLDRLTRSLLDFAKLVEALDKAGTSFVSITQSFNTTTSMGRLTLNMLLSFAQFEREVTAERIRDKIAASKAKGMWMGGIPPLGYRPQGRSLVIVADHAELVRSIYQRYQALGNVRRLSDSLHAEGIVTPRRKTGSGRAIGGGAFSRGQLYSILGNPIYTGRIAHRDQVYQGLHPAIIDQEKWEAVQRQLAGNVRGNRTHREASGSVLAGRIVDAAGVRLVASHARKGERRYRYYISKVLHEGLAGNASGTLRVPAGEIEQVVAHECAALLDDPLALAQRAGLALAPSDVEPLLEKCQSLAQALRQGHHEALARLVHRVTVHESRIEISLQVAALAAALGLAAGEDSPEDLSLTCNVRLTRTGRALRMVHDNGGAATPDGIDLSLVRLIVRARGWWARIREGAIEPLALAKEEGVSVSYIVRVLRLAFLSPAVVDAILDGSLRAGIDSSALLNIRAIMPSWEQQERACMLRR
ncbi:MAG: recombinase family protein [Novosphingobium sp.]